MSEPEVQLEELPQEPECAPRAVSPRLAILHSTMSEPEFQLEELSQEPECAPRIPEIFMYKNRLQEYTQRASIPLPVYSHIKEGSIHAPMFRASVFVDGMQFESPNSFSRLKAAELDAAKLALNGIYQKPKVDVVPFIRENTIFCKSVLNEFTVKMHMEMPIYKTEKAEEMPPVFVSEVIVNGVKFKEQRGKTKKEAEQMAALAAIISILDSGSRIVLSEIIKSKSKNISALSKVKDTGSIQSGSMPVAVSTSSDLSVSLNKRKEIETTNEIAPDASLPLPVSGSSGASLALSVTNQVATFPFHEFKKPKFESSPEVIAPPIIFVPPVSGETVESLPSSRSAKRRNRKKKKNVQGVHQLPIAATPVSQVPLPPLSEVPPSRLSEVPPPPLSQVPPNLVAQ